jgi:hypothetical protein
VLRTRRSGGKRPAATRARRRGGGERRRDNKNELGCSKLDADGTRTSRSARRTLRWAPGAAAATGDGAQRDAAAVKVRRRRAVGAEHGQPNKPHQRVPYHTADPRRDVGACERRRRHEPRRRRGPRRRRRCAARVRAAAARGLGVGRCRAGGALNRGVGPPGTRAHGTDAESEFNPSSTPARPRARRGARRKLTRGPRASEAAGGGELRWAGGEPRAAAVG